MLGRQQEFNLKLIQFVDAILLALTFWLSHVVRDFGTRQFGWERIPSFDRFLWQMLMIVPFTPIVLERFGFYSHPWSKSPARSLGQIAQGLLVMIVLTALIVLFGKQASESRAVLLIFPLFAAPALMMRETLTRIWLRKQHKAGAYKERVVLAGPPDDIDKLLAGLPREQRTAFEIVDRIDISTGPVERLILALHEKSVERVIFAAAHVHLNRIEEAVNACETEGVEAWVWADFIQTSIARPTFDALGGKPMLVFRCTPEVSWQLFIKGVIDRVGAAVLLILCLCTGVMVIAWLGIRIASPGPALFTQMRSGRHGHPFKMYKFRTMRTDAEQKKQELEAMNQMSGPVFKVERDPRIFPFGRLLRKLSIDELPQLFNVMRGEMSLVGPRPLPVYEVEKFADAAHRRRLSMKPGITCLWQISGRNNITDFDQWVTLDLKYIDNWSLWLDITILLRTVPAVLFGWGSR